MHVPSGPQGTHISYQEDRIYETPSPTPATRLRRLGGRGSVRGSPCDEPARLRFTSLCPPFFLLRGYPSSAKLVLGRPPPAATPPDPDPPVISSRPAAPARRGAGGTPSPPPRCALRS